MKKSLIVVLILLGLMFTGADLAFSDEIEWDDVKENPISAEMDSYPLLRQVMEGAFLDGEEMGAELLKTLSDTLPLLAALPAEDLESFAAAYSIPAEMVAESYYHALISTLRANITLYPDERNEAQAILKLLLFDDGEDGAKEAATPEALEKVMTGYQLPIGFLEYLQNREVEVEDEEQEDAADAEDDDNDEGDTSDADVDDDNDEGDTSDADIDEVDDRDDEDEPDAAIRDEGDRDDEDRDDEEEDSGHQSDDGDRSDSEDHDQDGDDQEDEDD